MTTREAHLVGSLAGVDAADFDLATFTLGPVGA